MTAILLKSISNSSVLLALGNGIQKSFAPQEIISSVDYTWEDHIVKPLLDNNILTKIIEVEPVIIPEPPAGPDPVITVQPVALPQAVFQAPQYFDVSAEGTPVLHYQWHIVDARDLIDFGYENVGNDEPFVTVSATQWSQLIYVTVSNSVGSVDSDVITIVPSIPPPT